MNQIMNIILTIYKVHTAPQRAMDCGPGLGGINQVFGIIPFCLLKVSVAYILIPLRDVLFNTTKRQWPE